VVNTRAALLSNFEVLSLLRELEADHISRTKTALRIKKEEEAATANGAPPGLNGATSFNLEASENLRTVEVEAISYLSADYLPTNQQTEEGIAKLVKSLAPHNLTKSEKLQIVNLAPTLPVELYVIVEELEDRFGDNIDAILDDVRGSIAPTKADGTVANGSNSVNGVNGVNDAGAGVIGEAEQWDEDADADYDEDVFDDTGAGDGIEGDLEMDDAED